MAGADLGVAVRRFFDALSFVSASSSLGLSSMRSVDDARFFTLALELAYCRVGTWLGRRAPLVILLTLWLRVLYATPADAAARLAPLAPCHLHLVVRSTPVGLCQDGWGCIRRRLLQAG